MSTPPIPLIRVNRAFLQGLFWFLVFLLLASFSSFARNLYDRLNQRPELRNEIIAHQPDLRHQNTQYLQRIVTAKNRGSDDAKEVRINIFVPNGRITRFRIASDEAYSVIDTESIDEEGRLALSIERLAVGAQVAIFIWATRPTLYDDRSLMTPLKKGALSQLQ